MFDGTRVTFDATRLQAPIAHEPLRDALRALSMRSTSNRRQGQACRTCGWSCDRPAGHELGACVRQP